MCDYLFSPYTGCNGQLCQFDDGFCGWIASGDLSWTIDYSADKQSKGEVLTISIYLYIFAYLYILIKL